MIFFMHISFLAEPCVIFMNSQIHPLQTRRVAAQQIASWRSARWRPGIGGLNPSKGKFRTPALQRPKIRKNPKIWGEASESSKQNLEVFRFCAVHSWEWWTCAGAAKVLSAMIRSSHVSCFSVSFWWWLSEFLQMVFNFVCNMWKWRTGSWFCVSELFLLQHDLNFRCFKCHMFIKSWYLQCVLAVSNLENETSDSATRPLWEVALLLWSAMIRVSSTWIPIDKLASDATLASEDLPLTLTGCHEVWAGSDFGFGARTSFVTSSASSRGPCQRERWMNSPPGWLSITCHPWKWCSFWPPSKDMGVGCGGILFWLAWLLGSQIQTWWQGPEYPNGRAAWRRR